MMKDPSIASIKSPFLDRPDLAECTVTDLAVNWLSEEGTVHSISLPNELTVQSIETHFERIGNLTNGAASKFLIDPKLSSMHMSVAARKMMGQKIEQHISRAAFLVDQKFLALGINIFFKMRKSTVPFRCFTNPQQAKDWLNQQHTETKSLN